jgi:hypothetical protein
VALSARHHHFFSELVSISGRAIAVVRDDEPEGAVTFSSHAKATWTKAADLARACCLSQLAERLMRF